MSAVIRLAEDSDAEAIRAIYAPIVETTVISFEQQPPSRSDIAERLSKGLVDLPWLVYVCDGKVLGYAYAGRHRARAAYQWSVESSVYVHDGARRAGVARGLYRALFDVLRFQGFFNLFAGITLPNPASVGFHESVGFRPIGVYCCVGFKFGDWRDVGWWQLSLQDRPRAPTPPTPLSSIRDDPAVRDALARGRNAIRD
ncbi:MAG: arsinothricin resistance N-acetyltransferase ArsN1 family B [Phycisphaerae bacterium]